MTETTKIIVPPGIERCEIHEQYIHKGDSLEIGNGDPVVVYSPNAGAVMLGTGMTGIEDVVSEIARKVGPLEGEQFEIFLPAGGAHFENVE